MHFCYLLSELTCISDHVNYATLSLKHAKELHGSAEDSYAMFFFFNEMHFSVRQIVLKCSYNKIVNFPS